MSVKTSVNVDVQQHHGGLKVAGEKPSQSQDKQTGSQVDHNAHGNSDAGQYQRCERHARRLYVARRHTAQEFPLHAAARSGDCDALKQLLDGKADPDQFDKSQRTALRYACGNGQIAVAQVLVEHAASVDLFDGLTHTTPLMMAARGGHYEVAKLLLLAKADVSIKDTKQERALVKALVFAEGNRLVQLTEMLRSAEEMFPEPWTEPTELVASREAPPKNTERDKTTASASEQAAVGEAGTPTDTKTSSAPSASVPVLDLSDVDQKTQ